MIEAYELLSDSVRDIDTWLSLATSDNPRRQRQAVLSAADLKQALLDREDKLIALSQEATGQESADLRALAEQIKEAREGRFAFVWHELLLTEGLV